MKYIHIEQAEITKTWGDNLIRHWCNEIEDENDPLYRIPTYKIHKIGTDEYYVEVVDVKNEKRAEIGLEPYYYEPTDIPVEREEPDEE